MSDFWARRKRAVEAEERAAAEAEARAEEAAEWDELEGLDDAEVCERLGLPDPDSIGPGDDVAAFMKKAVPQHLRNRALRRLWVSNPVLANLDGLADYNGDFRDNGLKGGVLRTSYQVGKGLAAHVKKMAEEAERRDAAGAEGAAADAKDLQKQSEKSVGFEEDAVENSLAEDDGNVRRSESIPSDSDPGGREESSESPAQSPGRSRMRFSFEEDDRNERPDAADTGRPVRRGPAPG